VHEGSRRGTGPVGTGVAPRASAPDRPLGHVRWTALLVVAGILSVTGCTSGPSEAELEAQSDLAWRMTVGTSEQVIARLPELFPEVSFTRNDFPEQHDRWTDCSSSSQGNAINPTAIQWSSLRQVLVDPPRETATFARALADSYVADGWTVSEERQSGEAEEGFAVDLHREGYRVNVKAVNTPSEELAPLVRVITVSPCVDAPDRMGDRPWKPGPTEPPAATASPADD
jgi:hypothetical protein